MFIIGADYHPSFQQIAFPISVKIPVSGSKRTTSDCENLDDGYNGMMRRVAGPRRSHWEPKHESRTCIFAGSH